MPPYSKFSKEEIVNAALEIVRKDGFSALTARALGTKLGTSSRPIFTVFKNMSELHQAVIEAAKKIYDEYIEIGLASDPPFKGVGTQYILFAIKEPKLFQLLFMKEQEDIPPLSGILPIIDDNYEKILRSVQADSRVDKEFSEWLYRHLWIYTHGIATLCASRMCRFTGEEIGKMVSEVYIGLLKQKKESAKK